MPTGLALARGSTGGLHRRNFAGCLLSIKQHLRDWLACFALMRDLLQTVHMPAA